MRAILFIVLISALAAAGCNSASPATGPNDYA